MFADLNHKEDKRTVIAIGILRQYTKRSVLMKPGVRVTRYGL